MSTKHFKSWMPGYLVMGEKIDDYHWIDKEPVDEYSLSAVRLGSVIRVTDRIITKIINAGRKPVN